MSNTLEAFIDSGMYIGRMISGSKSGYMQRHPSNIVVFNANICTSESGKIWHGDIDITKDMEKLRQLSIALGQDVYILREMDARFENEKSPKLKQAVAVFHPNGEFTKK